MWRSDRRKATLGKGKNRYTNDQQAHERFSTLVIIKEMQTTASVRYHFTPFRMNAIRNKTEQEPESNKCW